MVEPEARAGDRPQRSPHVSWIILDGEAVLFDLERKALSTLNTTGSLLWQLLDGTASLSELAADISDGFGADRDQVLDDVVALATDLRLRMLLIQA